MKVFQSIRFRIIIACIFFSLVVSLCYGWVTYYGLKYNSDELFNWFLIQETQVLVAEYQKNPQVNLSSMTSAKVIVSSEEVAIATLANYFTKTKTRERILKNNALDLIEMLGPRFTTPQGYIIYEFITKQKTIHILKAPLKDDALSFYYLVDVSEFINYDDVSEKEISDMFLTMLVLILCISLILGFWLAKRVVSPLTRLANSVDSDNYQPNNNVYFNDEIGFLAKRIDSFVLKTNEMIIREKSFSRDVSHELRTPLASSRAAIELALSSPAGKDTHMSKFLHRAARANVDMSHLIETFLLLGRDEIDKEVHTEFNLYELVQQSFDKHDYLKRSDELACLNKVAPTLMMFAAKRYLAIVLDNLIRNAYQHTYQGTIEVCVQNNIIIVEDTGEGMVNSKLVNDSDCNVLEKSGVGLSIVRRLCEKLNWKITIETDRPLGTKILIDISHE
ncbi:sensor histidine kinase [Litorilituus lipolyticus]|uniref:histidine kinase n=1 Tax=Litorilituus lipolyticus TaxID=2491017 RepID=A0A502KKL1_9GAMM|nr:HAMP domain-containing sensor histidine kinase [Litorilituus lipolyticus]TPH12120.1 HAMP domain-containing histidine kinase [Litorilituus lipolyticus]